MSVVLRPEAEQELLEAQAWYEPKALGLLAANGWECCHVEDVGPDAVNGSIIWQ